MYTDFTAQAQSLQQERELTERLERRRVAAERAVAEHGGQRLALIAHLARQTRRAGTAGQSAPRPSVAGC